MNKSILMILGLVFCALIAYAQKRNAEPDYYPMGYLGDTWTGEVTAFDNQQRTLTLTHVFEKKVSTFIVSIPDAPYEWGRDARNFRVIDFPFKKEASSQTFRYVDAPGSYYRPPGPQPPSVQVRPNPPATNVINDFSQFLNHAVTVYYTSRERKVGDQKQKYNDVWRIRVLGRTK